jgi:hypothetical protein
MYEALIKNGLINESEMQQVRPKDISEPPATEMDFLRTSEHVFRMSHVWNSKIRGNKKVENKTYCRYCRTKLLC